MKIYTALLILCLAGCLDNGKDTVEKLRAKALAFFPNKNKLEESNRLNLQTWKSQTVFTPEEKQPKKSKDKDKKPVETQYMPGDPAPYPGIANIYYFNPTAQVISNLKCDGIKNLKSKQIPCDTIIKYTYYTGQKVICESCGKVIDLAQIVNDTEAFEKKFPASNIESAIEINEENLEATLHYLRITSTFDTSAIGPTQDAGNPNLILFNELQSGLWRSNMLYRGKTTLKLSKGKITELLETRVEEHLSCIKSAK